MIMNYKECVARYGSLWRMKQAIAEGKLFKIEPGIYAETDHVPEELLILVYCHSGNRSKQASEKLAGLGYTNVYEFGGINDWTGDME